MKKKLFALILALVLILGATTFALAANPETDAGVRIRTGFDICPPGCTCCDDFEWFAHPVGHLWFGEHDLGHTAAMPSTFAAAPAGSGRYTGISVRHALPMTNPGLDDQGVQIPWGPRTVAVSMSTFTLDGAGAVVGKAGFELDFIGEAVEALAGTAATQIAGVTLNALPGTTNVLNVTANGYSQAVWRGNIQAGYTPAPQIGNYQATLTWFEVTGP